MTVLVREKRLYEAHHFTHEDAPSTIRPFTDADPEPVTVTDTNGLLSWSVRTVNGFARMTEGQWLVLFGDGSWRIYTDPDFHRIYATVPIIRG